MTESEWLAATDPEQLFQHLQSQRLSERKCLLLVVAYSQLSPAYGERVQWGGMLDVLAAFADRQVEWSEVQHQWRSKASFLTWIKRPCEWAAACVSQEYVSFEDPLNPDVVHCLRDIFGNPFRSIVVDPSWLTSTVLSLAKGIYTDRTFDRMPILADALQDAGCANDEILQHCRDESLTHVRGCWVVDSVLGKL